MKIEFNPITRQFFIRRSEFDDVGYDKIFSESEKINQLLSKYRFKVDDKHLIRRFIINNDIELQYYVYYSIAKRLQWTQDFYSNRDSLNTELTNIGSSAISTLKSIISKLIEDPISDSKKYVKSNRLSNRRYFRIDNYNRFIYQPAYSGLEIRVSTIMGHHQDPITDVGSVSERSKEMLWYLFDHLQSMGYKSHKFEDLINDEFKKSKSKGKVISERK